MAILNFPNQQETCSDSVFIQSYLSKRGILFEQWETPAQFEPNASTADVLEAYQSFLKPYMAKYGYKVADVISVNAQTQDIEHLKAKFLKEHTHAEDEVRFFVEGQGDFWFHLDDQPEEPVICLTCQAGDLISVPAGYRHWFDMGELPFVKAIRIFIDPTGWVPHYTDSEIEQRYQQRPVARVVR